MLYQVEFDGLRLFKKYTWDEALDMVLDSTRLTVGKIYHLDGTLLFNIDRDKNNEKEAFSS